MITFKLTKWEMELLATMMLRPVELNRHVSGLMRENNFHAVAVHSYCNLVFQKIGIRLATTTVKKGVSMRLKPHEAALLYLGLSELSNDESCQNVAAPLLVMAGSLHQQLKNLH